MQTRWLRPSGADDDEPRWGHVDGLQVGLHPLPGPRGLLRIYTPYLGHPADRLLNFVAVEPIPAGATERGFSELETSRLDGAQGKQMWSVDHSDDPVPHPSDPPVRGVLKTVDGTERLSVVVSVEPFANGAHVWVRVDFRADRPHEVGLTAGRYDDSVPLQHCILTATMGNFARLRRLHLAGRTVTPAELWPGFGGVDFAEHMRFGLADLDRTDDGDAVVSATTDEDAPHEAVYAPDTHDGWRYVGARGVQTWRVPDPDPALEVLVNARAAYWASSSPIPGGAAYENVEVVEPFREDRTYVFGVEPVG